MLGHHQPEASTITNAWPKSLKLIQTEYTLKVIPNRGKYDMSNPNQQNVFQPCPEKQKGLGQVLKKKSNDACFIW